MNAPANISDWWKPKQVAAHFALKEHSAYRWIADGTVPKEFVHRRGESGFMRINPEVLPYLERVFREIHEARRQARRVRAAATLQ